MLGWGPSGCRLYKKRVWLSGPFRLSGPEDARIALDSALPLSHSASALTYLAKPAAVGHPRSPRRSQYHAVDDVVLRDITLVHATL